MRRLVSSDVGVPSLVSEAAIRKYASEVPYTTGNVVFKNTDEGYSWNPPSTVGEN